MDFSEQQLVDCSFTYGNEGCNGGELSYAYQYLEDFDFTVLSSYPYHAANEVCKYNNIPYRPGAKIAQYIEHNNTNAVDMKAMVYDNAVSVALEAKNWKHYGGGIFDAADCGEDIDHGVVVVGYSTRDNYWRVKNSWGKRWGEEGFMRLPIGSGEDFVDGTCGIFNRPSYPKYT